MQVTYNLKMHDKICNVELNIKVQLLKNHQHKSLIKVYPANVLNIICGVLFWTSKKEQAQNAKHSISTYSFH